ncbi:VCBS repeat-containing protein [Streptomyces sp. NBC_00322]|uniref:FG-GAP and VCBS repeat-containing protein n=1 Tax=Streptomyces sp. NBC_00322 TaxID=2975712 RepID=UPI002E2DA89E|nr:FG-GAP and VCBS repeat-containing protein [Streptomyces sp. NBC_00322]
MCSGISRRVLAVVALAALVAAPLACDSLVQLDAGGKAKQETPDFNGDGYADLAVPGPLSTVDGVQLAGAVSVVYGSRSGPDTEHSQVVTRATAGTLGQLAARGTWFGGSPVARDFDGDGFTDLAVTVSTDADDLNGTVVLWGSSPGLSGGTTLPGGWGLHGGDFDGDGRADLLLDNYYGSGRGDGDGPTVLFGPLSRDGKARRKDSLGTSWGDNIVPRAIIVGDLTGDGRDDLVTSQGFEEMQERGRFFEGDEDGLKGHASDDLNSYSADGMIADFDGDGYGDLVVRDVGLVSEDSQDRPGELRVFRGSDSGPGSRAQRITLKTLGLPGIDEQSGGDGFGDVLAAADVNGDGYADLAVGLPGEDTGQVSDTGAVVLLLGGKKGLTDSGAQVITQDTPGVPGRGERGDHFGAALRTGDLNHDGHPDLAVGAPGEHGKVQQSGAVWILNGTAKGLSTTNVASFGPAALGAPEEGYDGTEFDAKGTDFGGSFTAGEGGCVAVAPSPGGTRVKDTERNNDTAPVRAGENGSLSCALPNDDGMSRWAVAAGIAAAVGSLLLVVRYRRRKAPYSGPVKTPWWACLEREPRPPVGQ